MRNVLFIIFIITGSALFSCKKDSFITSPDAQLSLSADSIKFDTVFTSATSVTRSFKIFNDNDQRLRISQVRLMGGTSSPFKININGAPVISSTDLEIDANDSIYVFVTVTINPSAGNLPFIISDSILINYNGNSRYVQLQAYGQKANFLNNAVISGNHNWTDTLPYVITGGIQIDTLSTLLISAGTRIYVHANAPFFVDGTLIIEGTKEKNVVFSGDRLDEPYKDFPASWPGILIRNTSINNKFTFAKIKNAYQAIVVNGPSENLLPKLHLQQSIIDNAYDAGLQLNNTFSEIENSLISNCGKNIVITSGGNYTFINCTVASYSTQFLLHDEPVLSISNSVNINGSTSSRDLSALFLNCILWGDNGIQDNEIVVTKLGSTLFSVNMDHCLYKASIDPAHVLINESIRNSEPLFDSIDINHRFFDFRTSKNAAAPGIDKGAPVTLLKDLENNARTVNITDIGCYEKP